MVDTKDHSAPPLDVPQRKPKELSAMRLTERSIRDLVCPAGMTERTYFDDDVPGFGLRVRASGVRSWLVQYGRHGKTKKITLGGPPLVTVGSARTRAREILAAVKLGGDPAKDKAEARAQAAHTLGALIPAFLDRQRKRLKPRSMIETERHLTKHARPLHAQGIKSIDRRAVAQLLEEIERNNGAACANSVRASLSALFTWAAHSGHIDANPVALTLRAVENGARQRVLSDDEIATIWNALDDRNFCTVQKLNSGGDYAALLKLLLLTGARRDEIARLRWSEIDLDAAIIRLSGERTKNGRPHTIPLVPQALEILRSLQLACKLGRDFVFGTNGHGFVDFSGARAEFDQRLNDRRQMFPTETINERWTLHDFRRTISTRLHGAPFSVAPHVVEALLGHVGGHRAGVAGVYNQQDYLPERRAALARWAEHVAALVEGRDSNVVALPARM
jgi:integrase